MHSELRGNRILYKYHVWWIWIWNVVIVISLIVMSQPLNLYYNLTIFMNTTSYAFFYNSYAARYCTNILYTYILYSLEWTFQVWYFHVWLVIVLHYNVLRVIHSLLRSHFMPIKKFNPKLTNTASGDTLIVSTTSHYTSRGLVKKTKVSKQNLRPSVSPSKSSSKLTYGLSPSIPVEAGQNLNFDDVLLEPLQLPKSKVRATHLPIRYLLTFYI